MNGNPWSSSISLTIVVIAMVCGQACAQEEIVEAQAAAEEVEEVVEVVGEEAAELVEADEMEMAMMAVPVDNNLLKLRAYARVQAALARRVCELTDDQQKSFAEIDDKWVDKIHRGQQRNAVNRRQPGLIAMFFGAQPAGNPRQRATGSAKSQIDDGIEALLSEEQRQALQQEQERRDQFRAEATADAMLESLQARLGMTAEQRAAIKPDLVPWAEKNNVQTLHYFSGNNYYPNIPEHLLSPHLDDDQMTAYRGLQKYIFTDENFNDGNAPIVIEQ